MHGVNRSSWGPWVLDVDVFTLDLNLDLDSYQVDLETCTNSAEVLDWIAQVADKDWASDAVIGGFVRAINDVLRPQENLCSGGRSRTLSGKEIRKLILEFKR